MISAENLIYEYIVKENAYYALVNIKADLTEEILKSYSEKEMERFRALEPKIWEYIKINLGESSLIDRYNHSSLFCSVFNDICNGVQYECCSQGHWKIDPLNGSSIPIPYHKFDEDLGISKEVAKNAIEKLIIKEKVKKKRGLGGYEYTPVINDLKNEMAKNPGKFKPLYFNTEIMMYDECLELDSLVKEAQKHFNSFQEIYEKKVNDHLHQIHPG